MSIKFVTEIVFTFIYVYIHLYTFIYIYIRLYTFIYCLGIIKPLKFPRLRAISLTQQAVARRQHLSTALCGIADSLH